MWIMSIILLADSTPILPGQRWYLTGVGPVTIIKTLPSGISFPAGPGKGMSIVYYTEPGDVGFCTRPDIRNGGKLLAYDKDAITTILKHIDKKVETDKLLEIMRKKREELGFETYKPPPAWSPKQRLPGVTVIESKEKPPTKIVEAEIIYPDKFNMLAKKKKD